MEVGTETDDGISVIWIVTTVTVDGKKYKVVVGVHSGCHSQCPGVLGLSRHTEHEIGAGIIWIVTEGGMVITLIEDGRIVFGPIVITTIELGMLITVSPGVKEMIEAAGVTEVGILIIDTLGGRVITGIEVGKIVLGPIVITLIDGGM
jgi:hypothetical protein